MFFVTEVKLRALPPLQLGLATPSRSLTVSAVTPKDAIGQTAVALLAFNQAFPEASGLS